MVWYLDGGIGCLGLVWIGCGCWCLYGVIALLAYEFGWCGVNSAVDWTLSWFDLCLILMC